MLINPPSISSSSSRLLKLFYDFVVVGLRVSIVLNRGAGVGQLTLEH
jgi:hypothetical protein